MATIVDWSGRGELISSRTDILVENDIHITHNRTIYSSAYRYLKLALKNISITLLAWNKNGLKKLVTIFCFHYSEHLAQRLESNILNKQFAIHQIQFLLIVELVLLN